MSLQSQTLRDRQRLKDLNRHANLKKLLTIFLLLGLSVAFFVFSNTQYGNSFRAQAMDFFRPALEAVHTPFEALRIWWQDKEQYFALKNKNQQLTEENKALKQLQVELVATKTENQYLRKTLNVPSEEKKSFVTAKILVKLHEVGSESFLLAAGSQHGIHEGAPVLSKDGVVGRVTWVSDKTARVINVTDRSFRLPVKKEDTDEHFIFSGDGKKSLYLLHSQGESKLENGETLVTSGRDGVFPAGIVVGKAQEAASGAFYVSPGAHLKQTEFVRVLIPEIRKMPKK